MKKTLRTLALLLSLLLILCACSPAGDPNGGGETQPEETFPLLGDDGEVSLESFRIERADVSGMDFSFSDRDKDPSYLGTETRIKFNGSTCTPTGKGVVDVNSTSKIKTVTIKSEGTFVLSGESTEYMVVIRAPETAKVQIVLKGAKLSSSKGPVIHAVTADKVFLTLAEGTENTLADGDLYILTEGGTSLDAAVFSHTDLTVNGSGSLTVNGNFKHGIVSKDDLRITDGKISVTALNVGLEGKDSVRIGGGEITVNAGSDGIRADNDKDANRGFFYMDGGKLSITAKNDAIQAERVINLAGGELAILAGGGRASTTADETKSHKGLKAGSDILVSGGKLTANAYDDAINSNGAILISGGELTLTTKSDAIRATHAIEQTGGDVNVEASYEALEARYIVLSGGKSLLHSEDDAINGVADDHDTAENPIGSAVLLSGTYLCVYAGKDGVDVDGSLAVTGGTVLIFGTTSDSRVFDYNSSAALTGGAFAALGGKDFLADFTGAINQATFACKLPETASHTPITLIDENGKAVLSITSAYTYETALLSAPALQKAKTYTVCLGGEVSGADENGFAAAPTQTGGTELGTLFFNSNLFHADFCEEATTAS